jgi:hypothetical protein
MKTSSPLIVASLLALTAALSTGCSSGTTGSGSGSPGQGTSGTSGGPAREVPPGSVPEDLVGTWSGARDGITERLIFNGDGTGSWESSIVTESSGGCLSFTRTLRDGTVVIDDTTITVHETSKVEQLQECRPPTMDTNKTATSESLQWHRAENDPTTILIIDEACAAKYPGQENCNTLGCPIALYCTSRLKRE